MIITRDLGENPKILPRINNPPEIVVVIYTQNNANFIEGRYGQ